MSYMTLPRLAFSGRFQADVSTINNDVRHYDSASFEPRFQLPQESRTVLNGWYNPDGTGAFHLIGLKIHQALSKFGADPSKDIATGLYVNAQRERSSAKIVDLDPQMQIVSTIFGLRIVLTDGEHDYMSGTYHASPFRDMANGRPNPASANFMSILTDLEWHDRAMKSPTLKALRKAADENGGRLSINLTPYAYRSSNREGPLIGSIGAYRTGEPETFVSGRRLANGNGSMATPEIGDLVANVDGNVLSFDFSNAIGLRGDLSVQPIGALYAAILKETDTVTGLGTKAAKIDVGVPNGATLPRKQLKLLSEIDYLSDGFLSVQGALADVKLDAAARKLITDHPVAIVRDSGADQFEVVLRETPGGFYGRADNFVHRMDPPLKDGGDAHANVGFKVTQWGEAVKGVTVSLDPEGIDVSNNYWGPGPQNAVNPPQAPYPNINTPADAVRLSTQVTTGSDGWAHCPLRVSNPGNPRTYVDGQIYTIRYKLAIAGAAPQAHFDMVVIHARQAHEYENPPPWRDIAEFMQQYDNLYPIMSRHLFSLADQRIFRENATLLSLAFSRPIDDPNHMPVTRDLSASKRQAVLNWLAQYTNEPAPKLAEPLVAELEGSGEIVQANTDGLPEPEKPSAENLRRMLASVDDDTHGKNPVLRNYLTAQIARAEKEG